MTTLYQSTWRSNPKYTAQALLQGRTHYVDDDTLKYFHCRILQCDIEQNGTLCWLIESVALDMNNTRRGFRYVVFDIFGTVISRVNLENSFSTRDKAKKALREYLASVNGLKITKDGLKQRKRQDKQSYFYVEEQLKRIA